MINAVQMQSWDVPTVHATMARHSKTFQICRRPWFWFSFAGSFELLALIFPDSPAFLPDFQTVLLENCAVYGGSKCGISTLHLRTFPLNRTAGRRACSDPEPRQLRKKALRSTIVTIDHKHHPSSDKSIRPSSVSAKSVVYERTLSLICVIFTFLVRLILYRVCAWKVAFIAARLELSGRLLYYGRSTHARIHEGRGSTHVRTHARQFQSVSHVSFWLVLH